MMASSSSRVAACLLLLAVVGVSAELRNSNNVRTARKNDDPCPLCAHDHPSSADSVLPADMHVLRLQAIKSQLLSKLRLQHRPNVSLDVPRKVLLETVQRSGDPSTSFNDLDRGPPEPPPDDVLPVTSEIITFASPGSQFNNHTLLEFTQSEVDLDALQVTEAILWVFVRRVSIRHSLHNDHYHHYHHRSRINGVRYPKTFLWVFRVPPDQPSTVHNSENLIGSTQLSVSEPGWQRINITIAATKWFTQPGEPLRLLVDCSSCSGHIEAVLFNNYKYKGAHKPESRGLEAAYRPFIVVRTKPSPTRRLARRALQCDKNTKHCCKEDFYVSFRELRWDDWILAPAGYHANYCRGSCDSIYQTPDGFQSMHAHLVEETRRVREPDSISHCCAPTRFSTMTLIYIDDHESIIKRDVPRMVVEECGCA